MLLAQSDVVFVCLCSLSCAIRDNNSTAGTDKNLLLPGNQFSAPLPAWATTKDVKFLSVPSTWWERWRDTVLEVLVGLAMLSATILWARQGNLRTFFCFTPKSSTVQLQLYAAKLLAILNIAVLVVAVC